LPFPRRPPINALYITAVGITSPAASISSNTLTASPIRPLLHHQRSPWRSQGRRHRVPASRAEALLRAAGPCAGARRRSLRPCRIAPTHARTTCVLAVSHLAYTACVPQPQLHSHARASTASLKPAPALPCQSSSARAPPRRELRFSAAWPAYRSRVCATPPARAASTPVPAAARCLLPCALQHLPKPSRRTQHLLTRSTPPSAPCSWARPSLRSSACSLLPACLGCRLNPPLGSHTRAASACLCRRSAPPATSHRASRATPRPLRSARLRASHQPSHPRAPSNCRPLPLLCAARSLPRARTVVSGSPGTRVEPRPWPVSTSRQHCRMEEEKEREMLPPVVGERSQLEEEQREKEEEKKRLDDAAAGGKEKGWETPG
jgi:hypothetical protein